MSIKIEELTRKFREIPSYKKKGILWLAKYFKTSEETIRLARQLVREENEAKSLAQKPDKYVDSRTSNKSGEDILILKSSKALSPQEIDELAQVDNLNSFVTNYWIKSQESGIWTYSVQIRKIIDKFYDGEEFKKKISELFKDIEPKKLPKTAETNTLTVLAISDDHVGMLIKDSIFNKEWNDDVYENRLLSIIPTIPQTDKLVILSLGDQLNGWNEQTTRGGHIVSSTSNREQFDSYVKARKIFYDFLFTSGTASQYCIIEVNNSNHSGLGYSYMANALLKQYIELKYPEVEFQNEESFISKFEYGQHTIYAVHGKDDTHQKRNFPLNLDQSTEVFFTDYILADDVNPKKRFVTVYKADLHRFNENQGKNFRYINVPSIANGSDWQERNHGTSKPGALIEIYSEDDPEPYKKVIRFDYEN